MTTDEPLFEGDARLGLVDSLDLYSWRALPFFPVGAAFFIWLAVGEWLPFRGPYTNVFLFSLSGVMLLITLLGLWVLVRSFIRIRRAGPVNVALKIFPESIGWKGSDGTWRESAFSAFTGRTEDRRGLFLLGAAAKEGNAPLPSIFVPRACFRGAWPSVRALLNEKVQRAPTS